MVQECVDPDIYAFLFFFTFTIFRCSEKCSDHCASGRRVGRGNRYCPLFCGRVAARSKVAVVSLFFCVQTHSTRLFSLLSYMYVYICSFHSCFCCCSSFSYFYFHYIFCVCDCSLHKII
uniref:Uncharacterized protein n=1 Tax=Trypanosoma congolense (strain IL3000) TaxID=1068625 RepID=G0UZ53_TRYCI|nr:hypothetical protein, unlikely [Trypanosoma congolense IL3000]